MTRLKTADYYLIHDALFVGYPGRLQDAVLTPAQILTNPLYCCCDSPGTLSILGYLNPDVAQIEILSTEVVRYFCTWEKGQVCSSDKEERFVCHMQGRTI